MNKKDLKSIEEAQKTQNTINSFTELIGIIMIGNMIIELLNKDLPKMVTLEFDKFYIDDLRIHWKEMLEQQICETIEEEEPTK